MNATPNKSHTGLYVSLGVLAIIVMLIVVGLTSYVSANNYGAATEARLQAKYDDNQNVLSNYTAGLQEMAQIPSMYTEDLTKVVKADIEGRYGANGSSATMQWIKEHKVDFDSSLYSKIQQAIEAGRKEFATNQREMLDIKRGYQASLNYAWRGFWLHAAGFPKKDLEKYNIVVTADVQNKFRTGTDAPVLLRAK